MKFGFLFLLISTKLAASTPAIYGPDNRIDTFLSPNPFYQLLADSTAAQVPHDKMSVRGDLVDLRGPTLGQAFKLCSDQRFINQPFIANCSGTLIAPDVILTAGHCYESKDKCTRFDWVFNYKVSSENQNSVTVRRRDVYRCKEVIKQELRDGKVDYALIRLDRRVQGVSPIKVTQTPLSVGTDVVMIGHPSGLPQKIADGAFIKRVDATVFKSNLDAFQINSGSGVFDTKSGELLGVLVRGVVDYKARAGKNCMEVSRISDDQPGEEVSSFTQFSKHLNSL